MLNWTKQSYWNSAREYFLYGYLCRGDVQQCGFYDSNEQDQKVISGKSLTFSLLKLRTSVLGTFFNGYNSLKLRFPSNSQQVWTFHQWEVQYTLLYYSDILVYWNLNTADSVLSSTALLLVGLFFCVKSDAAVRSIIWFCAEWRGCIKVTLGWHWTFVGRFFEQQPFFLLCSFVRCLMDMEKSREGMLIFCFLWDRMEEGDTKWTKNQPNWLKE